jgi:hypothetical protein
MKICFNTISKFSFFAIILTAVIACNKGRKTKNTSTEPSAPLYQSFKPKVKQDTIGGIYHEYYENGNVKVKGIYKNNKRDGDWSFFYDNGKLWSWGEYNEGLRNGGSSVYYENGVLKMEGKYLNNKQVGLWKFYNKEGKLIKEVQM